MGNRVSRIQVACKRVGIVIFFLLTFATMLACSPDKNVVALLAEADRTLFPAFDTVEGFACGSGDGKTESSAFLISTPEQLANLKKYTYTLGHNKPANYFKLINDIDLTDYLSETPDKAYADGGGFNGGKGWEPIGNAAKMFCGSLDGANFEISGLWIDRAEQQHVGLFGVTYITQIKNLKVSLSPKGITGKAYVGGLAGMMTGNNSYPPGVKWTVGNCSVTGTVSASVDNADSCVGGLFGAASELILRESYFVGAVNGFNSVGGLAGIFSASDIENCYVRAVIGYSTQAQIVRVGGFSGKTMFENRVENSYAVLSASSPVLPWLGIPVNNVKQIVRGCYYNDGGFAALPYETEGNVEIYDSEGLSAEKMKKQASYQGDAGNGFDFLSAWGIVENTGYPYLKKPKNHICIQPDGKTYDGTGVVETTYTISGHYDESRRVFVSLYTDETDKKAGLYEVGMRIETQHNYQMTKGRYEIRPAPLYVRAEPAVRTPRGHASFSYTVSGFIGGEENAPITGDVFFDAPAAKTVKRGKYPIAVSGTLSAENYVFFYPEPGSADNPGAYLMIDGLYAGEIAGIAIGAAALLALMFFALYWFAVKKRSLSQLFQTIKKPFVKIERELVIQRETVYVEVEKADSLFPLPDALSAREREVALLMLEGLSRKEIAAKLFVSESTIKKHIEKVLDKSGCARQKNFIVRYGKNKPAPE